MKYWLAHVTLIGWFNRQGYNRGNTEIQTLMRGNPSWNTADKMQKYTSIYLNAYLCHAFRNGTEGDNLVMIIHTKFNFPTTTKKVKCFGSYCGSKL